MVNDILLVDLIYTELLLSHSDIFVQWLDNKVNSLETNKLGYIHLLIWPSHHSLDLM